MATLGCEAAFFRAVCVIALLTCTALPFIATSQDLDFVNATLIDGTGAAPRKGVTISVRGGKIATLAERAPAPAAAVRALQSGVTTARVLGDTFDSELRGPDRIAAATRALIAQGADVIKVGASERAGLVNTDPRRPELTEDEMRAAVPEVSKSGLYVTAHAHAREGVAAAVNAGVRSVEHGTWVDDATLAEMKRRDTYFVPTLAVMSPLGDPQGNSANDVALQLRTQSMMGPLRAAHLAIFGPINS